MIMCGQASCLLLCVPFRKLNKNPNAITKDIQTANQEIHWIITAVCIHHLKMLSAMSRNFSTGFPLGIRNWGFYINICFSVIFIETPLH